MWSCTLRWIKPQKQRILNIIPYGIIRFACRKMDAWLGWCIRGRIDACGCNGSVMLITVSRPSLYIHRKRQLAKWIASTQSLGTWLAMLEGSSRQRMLLSASSKVRCCLVLMGTTYRRHVSSRSILKSVLVRLRCKLFLSRQNGSLAATALDLVHTAPYGILHLLRYLLWHEHLEPRALPVLSQTAHVDSRSSVRTCWRPPA
jgi:hypothetical protein